MYFDNQPIIQDFQTFLDYIINKEQLSITNDKKVLKAADLMILNEKMQSFQTRFTTNKQNQQAYTLLNSFYFIAKAAKLVYTSTNPKGVWLKYNESKIAEYESMTNDEKYFFLVESFWTVIDMDEAFDCRNLSLPNDYELLFKENAGKRFTIDCVELKRKGQLNLMWHIFFEEMASAFGWFELYWDSNITGRLKNKYAKPYAEIAITPLGKIMIPILRDERPPYHWNMFDRLLWAYWYPEVENLKEELDENDPYWQNFEDAFLPYFPALKIEKRLINFRFPLEKGNYTFKISLAKDLYKVLEIAGSATFEELHLAIQKAFDFDNDHLYFFSLNGKLWSDCGVVFWAPDNDEGVRADMAMIGEVGLDIGQSFLYLFDFGDEWHFDIQLLAIHRTDDELKDFVIKEEVGENPKQYEYDDDDDYDDDDYEEEE